MNNIALLVIDIQNDYFPGGKSELIGPVEASLRAKKLLVLFREKRSPVIHVRHISTRKGATYFLPGTAGAQINENVKPLPGEVVIEKHFPNSFRETTLLDHLKKTDVERLLICGMMTHMCIDSTTRAAFDHGFECILAQDACATKDLAINDKAIPAWQVHASFLAALNGMFAKVVSTDTIELDLQ